LTAYGGDGLLWRSRRLALDDVRVEGTEGNSLLVCGFFGGHGERFAVDIGTGAGVTQAVRSGVALRLQAFRGHSETLAQATVLAPPPAAYTGA
jgi:hypothetical protein